MQSVLPERACGQVDVVMSISLGLPPDGDRAEARLPLLAFYSG